jgi:hypothetical protein
MEIVCLNRLGNPLGVDLLQPLLKLVIRQF